MTTNTMKLDLMVDALPVDMKIALVDRILESLSPSRKEIDELWKIEVERRIEDVESGRVQSIPGDEVFANIRARFGK